MEIFIREITENDISHFTFLAAQLGYSTNETYIAERIKNVDGNEVVYIALSSNVPVGWIDCRISRTFLVEPICEIVGLVVNEDYRSNGIGRLLNDQCEKWAIEKRVKTILVRSNVKRKRAHHFYLTNGYTLMKKSCVFIKQL